MSQNPSQTKKFNTFNGVFIPSYEAILGAVLFLILPYLVAGMGFFTMVIIVLLANTVTLATSFSIADCATNLNKIGGGGMYAVSKKSLGKAFGGSIGIQLYLAQAMSIGFYAIGFAKALQPILYNIPVIQNFIIANQMSLPEQYRYIGLVIAFIAFIAGIVGADFIVKIQMIIFVILSVSVAAILLSPFFNINLGDTPVFQSFANLKGIGIPLEIGGMMGFWIAFTTFFPAVTGIDAGVGMSGSLKNPRKSLVKGTFLAIGITTVIYILITYVFSRVNPDLLAVKEIADSGRISLYKPTALDIFIQSPVIYIIIIIGILFATGSSALSYFMTSPRTCQALAKDKILPGFLSFLGKDFKPKGTEPRWATLLTFLIIIPIIWPGNVTTASRIVGICFLVVYGWINLAAFLERISRNPSFRPTSKGHWSISLYGFAICMGVIALDNLMIGIGVILSQGLIFFLLLKFKSQNKLEGVWWGVVFSMVTRNLFSLKKIVQGTKNWRPILNCFAFAGEDNNPQKVAYLAEKIALYQGMVNLNIINNTPENQDQIAPKQFKIPTRLVNINDSTEAILSIIQSSHPGDIEPNSILLEYTRNINSIEIINQILKLRKNVFLLKNGSKLADHQKIDIWWRGEKNGNLMVLLAYIINNTLDLKTRDNYTIRIIRKIGPDENTNTANNEMHTLLEKARLTGEVIVLPHSNQPFPETLYDHSKDADLIMMGLPGNINKDGLAKLFKLNEVFFDQDIIKYDNLPAILFVKSAYQLNLLVE
ncbi:MAG: amino acid permease [Spirochaetes bacterium]|nr:amino acid permease [Spirochaetota bacterium]